MVLFSHQNLKYAGVALLVLTAFLILLDATGSEFLKASYSLKDANKAPTDMRSISASVKNALGVAKAQSQAVPVTHVTTPSSVKAIYMTGWVAGTSALRTNLVKLADQTEVNSIVIDIKDYTGRISFQPNDPYLKDIGSGDNRIVDIDNFIGTLHQKGIYVIGRIAVFQDPYMAAKDPDMAFKKISDGKIWKDSKGISWINADSKAYWDYIAAIAKESYGRGFDEIQFDYIRYPSDGKLSDIDHSNDGGKTKHEVIKDFYTYINDKVKSENPGLITSADLFGMTTTDQKDDMNIGQVLEDALTSFDYVSPMVYPSHFANGWGGFANPAAHPYDVIKISMQEAVVRAKALGVSPLKLRPWLQDFNLGATYTDSMVKAQIQATYDVGLNSWLLWNASNHYHDGALEKQI